MRRSTLLLLLALICAQCAAEGDLSEAAAFPAPDVAAAPSTAQPDDDSVRCRMSGICETWPTREACAQGPAAVPSAPSRDPAAARDATLACTFDASARAEAVRDAARWTWKGYRDCALGHDELRPLSCSGQHWHNLTLTPVDALDTLFLMGLRDEFDQALEAVRDTLRPGEAGDANVFETTIRILGGLLSAQQLTAATASFSGDETEAAASRVLLEAAADLGARLARGFASPSGFPYSDVHLSTGIASSAMGRTSTSEGTTLSLEFTLLARLTGEPAFEAAAMRAHAALAPEVDRHGGLLPQWVDPADGATSGDYFMLGARSDSYFEYLLKQWIMTGRNDTEMLNRYVRAMQAVREKLLRRTRESGRGDDGGEGGDENDTSARQKGLLYIGEIEGGKNTSKMDHLVCFLPGVLALGDFFGVSTARPDTADASDIEVAAELAETCYQLYRRTPTGLAPEIVFFSESEVGSGDGGYPGAHAVDVGGGDFYIKDADAHNLLRPETVESLFVLWRVTGDPRYRDHAWAIFRAFERWTRVEGAQQCFATEPGTAVGAAVWEAAGAAAAEAAGAAAAGAGVAEAEARGVEAGRAALRELRLHRDDEDQTSPAAMVEDAALAAARATAAAVARALHAAGTPLTTTTAAEDLARQILDSMAALEPQQPPTEGPEPEHPTDAAPAPLSLPTHPTCPPSTSMRGGGYSNLNSVTEVPPPRRDKMESFWIAETLKYLYLIFVEPPERCLHPSCEGRDLLQPALPLSAWVFNTEAHPLPVVGPADASRIAVVEGLDPALLRPYGESVAEAVDGSARAAAEAEAAGEEESGGEESGGGAAAPAMSAEEEQEMWEEINEAMAGAAAEESQTQEMWQAMQQHAQAGEAAIEAESVHSEL